MLHEAWFIARKDIWHMLRSRETMFWLFIMPLVFVYFVGTITGGFGGGRMPGKDILALRAPANAGFLADRLVKHLEANGFTVVRPAGEEAFAAGERRLTIPGLFTESVLSGKKVAVQLALKDSGVGRNYDEIRVGRSVFTTLADVMATVETGATPGPEQFRRLDGMPRSLSLEVRAAGRRRHVPTGFEQAVPGTMVQFSLIILLATGGALLVIERRQGLLRRLAATPISNGAIVLGKWIARLGLGLAQIVFAMIAGTLFFRMNWGPDLIMVFLVLLAWGALCASVGLLLGNIARSEGQAVGIGVLSGNLLAAFGGCWWPVEITPVWMQAFAKMLPTGWAMDALHRLISFQAGAASVLPHLAAILASSLVILWLTARRFRFF